MENNEQAVEYGKAKRVLLAEDEAMVRRLAERMISSAGYEVEIAENGLEAREKANHDYYAVVTDLKMPALDGVGLVKYLREELGYGGRVVLVTGTSGEIPDFTRLHGIQPETFEAYDVAILDKPFRIADLLNALSPQAR
jgi:CheY-like chemotaxis protein